MLAGGAEELHPIDAAVFDILFATSTRNDAPTTTPRPFDRDRDGLVVGEGAARWCWRSSSTRARAARASCAEVVGFGTNCDGTHVTSPDAEGMRAVMRLALADAGLGADARSATSTRTAPPPSLGDIAESRATHRGVRRRACRSAR